MRTEEFKQTMSEIDEVLIETLQLKEINRFLKRKAVLLLILDALEGINDDYDKCWILASLIEALKSRKFNNVHDFLKIMEGVEKEA